MKTMSTKHLGVVAALGASLLLTSCGAGPAAQNQTPAPDEAQTISISNEFGTAEVPADPQRALGFYTTDTDILITLGIKLADQQPIRGDNGFTTFPDFFPQEALAGVTPFANYPEFNYEKVLEANPDFILSGLSYDTEIPKKLSPIAPTYNYNGFDGADWRTHFKKTAEVLNRTEQYQAWMDKYQARIDEVKAKIKAAGIDPVVANMSFYDGKVGLDCYGIACLVFDDLGLKITPLARDNDGEGTQLSLEQLDKLKGIDEVFTSVGVGEDRTLLQTSDKLNASSVWKDLGFVKDDQITGFNMEMVYGSPSGQMALVDVVEKALLP
ncbi:ABC transporter substrate-binding protein [Paeniglutamicibacter sp. NPDC091659]|uniref:ABC transporter substrate-binding protein n=1 Tax=Paeniglutamicibacter sp. NPDC091659 TaxID=3364389 RepID=UPI00381DF417